MLKRLHDLSIRIKVTSLLSIRWHLTSTQPLQSFISRHFEEGLLCLLPQRFHNDLPAIYRWFKPAELRGVPRRLHDEYLLEHGSMIVSLERSSPKASFEQFSAPFALFLAYTAQKIATPDFVPFSLYLAQHDLRDLPAALQADLPTPELIKSSGKGDIYGSSIWLGIPPTRTPLHRDPNPNLFVQLTGRKTIRLLRPNDGKRIYHAVREAMMGDSKGDDDANWGLNVRGEALSRGKSEHMRGDELMGNEGAAADEIVWGRGKEEELATSQTFEAFEATLEAGDGLFIPQGWWHSVRGVGTGINASVNWWFR